MNEASPEDPNGTTDCSIECLANVMTRCNGERPEIFSLPSSMDNSIVFPCEGGYLAATRSNGTIVTEQFGSGESPDCSAHLIPTQRQSVLIEKKGKMDVSWQRRSSM